MPDANKFAVLNALPYRILPCCGLCQHGVFVGFAADPWGYCSIIRYEHLKHDNPKEGTKTGIHRLGSCPKYEASDHRLALLESYQVFFCPGV